MPSSRSRESSSARTSRWSDATVDGAAPPRTAGPRPSAARCRDRRASRSGPTTTTASGDQQLAGRLERSPGTRVHSIRPLRSSSVTTAISLPVRVADRAHLADQPGDADLGAVLERRRVGDACGSRPWRARRASARADARRGRSRAPPSRAWLRSRGDHGSDRRQRRRDHRDRARSPRRTATTGRSRARDAPTPRGRARGRRAANSAPRSVPRASQAPAATRLSSTRRLSARASSRYARSNRSRERAALGARGDQRLDRRLPDVAHRAESEADLSVLDREAPLRAIDVRRQDLEPHAPALLDQRDDPRAVAHFAGERRRHELGG